MEHEKWLVEKAIEMKRLELEIKKTGSHCKEIKMNNDKEPLYRVVWRIKGTSTSGRGPHLSWDRALASRDRLTAENPDVEYCIEKELINEH